MIRRVLVTGFAPWAHHRENPSSALACAMDGLAVGDLVYVAKAPLPVEFERAERCAHEACVEHGAFAHVALGLAASATELRIERFGRDHATQKAMETPFEVPSVLKALHERGIAALASDDAGDFVCNDLYFRALTRGARPTLFVHVPPHVMAFEGIAEALAEALAAGLED